MAIGAISSIIKGIVGSGGNVASKIQSGKTARIGNIRGWASPIIFLLTAFPFAMLLWAWFGSIFFSEAQYISENAINIVNTIGPKFFFSIISILLTGSVGAGAILANKRMNTEIVKHEKEIEVVKEIVKQETNFSPFEKAFKYTLGHEGGYVNDPDDTGGETYKGIARNHHSKWVGWNVIDRAKRRRRHFPENLNTTNGLDEAVQEFYKENFWDRYKCDKVADISEKISIELFDSVVNTGSHGVKFLQRAINNCTNDLIPTKLEEDGKIGRATLDALGILIPRYEKAVYKSQNGELYEHYERICLDNPTNWKFFRGLVQNRT